LPPTVFSFLSPQQYSNLESGLVVAGCVMTKGDAMFDSVGMSEVGKNDWMMVI
jgi:hypothetical protein